MILSVLHALIRGFSFGGTGASILVMRIYRLNAGLALELPCGAVPSYALHPPHPGRGPQRLSLESQEKGRLGKDLMRSPAPSQDSGQPPERELGSQLQGVPRSYYG